MINKCASYLSAALLSLPLVAQATEQLVGSNADLRPQLQAQAAYCAAQSANLDGDAQRLLVDFYLQREGRRAWQTEAQQQQLREQIEQLADDGLQPDEYPLPTPSMAEPSEQRDCADLLTSHSYLQALLHLRRGRLLQQRLEPLWRDAQLGHADPRLATLSLALYHLDDPARAFAQARPANERYRRLRAAYAAQRRQPLAEWSALPNGPLLRPAQEDARLAALRTRLAAEGYLHVASNELPEAYDSATAAALQRFQAEHGLKDDGILGPASLVELNLSAQHRRDQLRANLERLRWLADDLDAAQVAINVAAAELLVVREGRTLWRTRTQVGRPARRTPLLASRITRLTLNPTWTVPPTILREDKLPAIREDIAYLEQNQLSVFDRDGNRLDPQTLDWSNPGSILLRQAAGIRNPLGRAAVRFTNPFSVYLHDTPSQQLFDKAPRPFSSGCVRVETIDTLLAWLLAPDEVEGVQSRIASGKTQEYRLQHPAPLLIAYWTAEASADGSLHYAPDIYDLDARLIAALAAASTRD
nr:L,D-transpeptidase family protein [uncultured Pseudomonas sp.]